MQLSKNLHAFGVLGDLAIVANALAGPGGPEGVAERVVGTVRGALAPAATHATFRTLDPATAIESAFAHAHAAVHELVTRDGGASVAAVWMLPDRVVIAHLGDARVYRFRAPTFGWMTLDHTFVQDAVSRGMLALSEADRFDRPNALQRMLGEALVPPTIRVVDRAAGDRFLVCTSGIWRNLSEIELRVEVAGARDPRATADDLCMLVAPWSSSACALVIT